MALPGPPNGSTFVFTPGTRRAKADALAPEAESGFPIPSLVIILLVLALGWVLFAWRVHDRGIWSSHEGRAAQNAQSMLDSGNWLIPTLFTEDIDVQKPPLYYWSVAALSIPGHGKVTPRTIRLPATVSALIGLVLVVRFGKRLWNLETGFFAAIILATTTRYAWLGRVGRIDMPLTVLITACFFCFWRAHGEAELDERKRSRLYSIMYLLLGVATLLKGPVAVVLVLMPIISYLAAIGEPIVPGLQRGAWRSWSKLRVPVGLLLVVAIAGPWFVYAIVQSHGEYFWDFFVYHNLERALGTTEELKPGPVWFYFPRILVDGFPWSILFPVVGMSIWKHRRQWRIPTNGAARGYLFLLCWIGSQFVFLSLVSFKRPDYLLPVFPAIAMLLAGWLNDRSLRFTRRINSRPARNPRRRARAVLVTASLLVVLTAPLLVWASVEFRKKGVVKSIFKIDLVEKYLNPTDRFMMDHVERMLRQNWPLLGIAVVVVVGCVWVLHTGWYDRQNRKIIASLAIPWVVCFLFQVQLFLPAIDPLREMSRFGEVIRMVASKGRTIYYFDKFDADLVFHAGKPARMVGDWNDLARLGQSEEPCFVVMKASHLEYLHKENQAVHWFPVADNRQTAFGEHREARVLVTNHPYSVTERLHPSSMTH
ncbi:MAG: glycosyltransferase family 39 protein [Planctomycetota bacterium]